MDYNVSPYNDDFDEKKNYHKVLYKPGFPVQARELNVTQSMLQNQIASIGNHLFKNGSKISGCTTKFVQYDYVRLNDVFNGQVVVLSKFNDKDLTLIGSVSKVEAKIVDVTEKNTNDPATLYVNYTKTGVDNKQSVFINGEDVLFYDKNGVLVNTCTVRCPSCPNSTITDTISPTGKSYFFNVENGTFYYNGYFVNVLDQHLIIEKYLTKDSDGNIVSSLTYQVGFDVVESTITVDDDVTLYDPHLGYPNYASQGADRYKIDMKLSMRDYNDTSNSSFIMLAKVRQNATVEYKKDDTEYAQIMNEIARRTYETSGDFTVNAWTIKFLNEKKSTPTDSLGWVESGDDNNFITVLGTGTGYVKGYRVSSSAETILRNSKARDTKKLRGASLSFSPRQNITVSVTAGANIGWLSQGISTMSNQQFNILDSANNTIGTFKLFDITKLSSTSLKLYIYDIKMGVGKVLSLGKTIKVSDGSFTATIADTTTLKLENATNTSLLFPIGYKAVKTIRDNDNNLNGNTTLQIRKRLSGILDSNGTITFNSATNETFVSPLIENAICWVKNSPNGISIDIGSTNATYTPTSLKLNLGTGYANATVSYVATVVKTNQQEDTKTVTSHTYTTSSSPSGLLGDVISLPHADGYKIDKIKLISISDSSVNIDVTSEYSFDNGQADNFYTAIKIKRNVARTMLNDYRLVITYYYFERSGSAGFCTVDSYSQLINDANIGATYKDIPSYTDNNGTTYKLAECVDFRSINMSESVNTSAIVPLFNSIMTFDIEYYLPRYDLLQVNQDGTFYYKHGVSSESPVLPTVDENAMALYEVYQNAYVYELSDITMKYRDNKRFTMHDIGRLETRITNLEYSVSLSLLEMQTVNMDIKDASGNSRYKNGFIVDNFKNYTASDITNSEFKASLDRTNGRLRPQFKQNNVRLKFDQSKSTNIVTFGNMAMSAFESDLFISNPNATTTLSINPYMIFRRTGTMALSPNIDTWSDTTQLPTITTTIDAGVDALKQLADATKVTKTDYGTWVDYNKTILDTTTKSSTSTSGDGNITRSNTTYTTTQTDSSRTVTTTGIGSETQSYTIDDIVKDVSISPYVRANTIQFYATNMKPNTQVYAFFDGVAVTQHCKGVTQVSTEDDVVTSRNKSIYGGMPLVTDADGSIIGEFRIPEKTFFTGEKKFVLTNDVNNSGNSDVETTRSESTYFAGGVNLSKQSSTLNVITPTFNTTTSVESKSTTSTSRSTTVSFSNTSSPSVVRSSITSPNLPEMPDYTPGGNWSSHFRWTVRDGRWDWDPIAQGFKVDESCFISKVGVYFSSIDTSSDIVWFELREMINGYPSSESLTHKEVKPSSITKSDDASLEYVVEFNCPVYVDASKSYAFVIGGFSPETRVYISTLGNKLIGQDRILEQPPLAYTMFRSLNGETWNAQQYDTMKINIYRCVFNTSETNVSFYADYTDNLFTRCSNDPIQVQPSSNRVRVYCPDHSLRVNDRATITFSNDLYYTLEVTSGMPQIGQTLTTTTASGTIKDIKVTSTLNTYLISFVALQGYFTKDQVFSCTAQTYKYRDIFLISDVGMKSKAVTQNDASGYIRNVSVDGIPTSIGGVDPSIFSQEHIVKDVDSIDSFIIEVNANFTSSGRFGGKNVMVYGNGIKYDTFNISGTYLTYDTIDKWTISPYKTSNEYATPFTFKPQNDTNLDSACILLDSKNTKRLVGDSKSMSMVATVQTRNPYISAVFNTDTFSITTVSNRIEYIDKTTFNTLPVGNQYKDETDTLLGSESYKYITSKVLLNNSATDMRILFDVYCAKEATFDVYVKLFSPYGSSDDSLVSWQLVDKITKTYSSGISNMIEYDITLSKLWSKWTSTTEYNSFRIKLVGKSTDSCKPVIFENFRAIAIT